MLLHTPKTLLDFAMHPSTVGGDGRKQLGDQTRQQMVMHNAEVIRDVLCMLNSLCGSASTPGAIGTSMPATSYTNDAQKARKLEQRPPEALTTLPISTSSEVKSKVSENLKPVNLTRHHLQAFDADLVYPESMMTKGQFVCPNCTEDFLNRDALAMHMMESVHSEACVNSSKENRRSKKLAAVSPAAATSKTSAPVSPPENSCSRRFLRLPIPPISPSIALPSSASLASRCSMVNGNSNSMQIPNAFHSLLQAFVKVSKSASPTTHSTTSPISSTACPVSLASSDLFQTFQRSVDKPTAIASSSRPGRKPRRLLIHHDHSRPIKPLHVVVKPFELTSLGLYKNGMMPSPMKNNQSENQYLSPGHKRRGYQSHYDDDALVSRPKRSHSCEPDNDSSIQPERVHSAPNNIKLIQTLIHSKIDEEVTNQSQKFDKEIKHDKVSQLTNTFVRTSSVSISLSMVEITVKYACFTINKYCHPSLNRSRARWINILATEKFKLLITKRTKRSKEMLTLWRFPWQLQGGDHHYL